MLDLDAGGVPCRLYLPAGAAPGVVVHAHGGGFVFNDVAVHDASCRRLANRTGTAVLSVDYRLAPEHPFPAAVEDLDAVVAWLDEHGEGHGLTGPTYGHGDSAGANLVLVAALRHPDRFRALALVYPFLDPTAAGASHHEEVEGFDPRDVAWYWEQYTGGDARHHADPDLAPLLSDRLGTLPPTFVMTSEHDPLRDEGELLAARLAETGVEVLGVRYLGQVHGFWRHPDAFPAAEPLLRQAAAFLRDH
ncbi:alpha/beta hydrolase [Nocardioides dongxiaopingii]|uniref:alpha/beta hydrolase n=1 Tax=Nocardioides sp. S-1144 TaxID=2582905 RepID=UPI00110E6615|nr:alpha/beta hydrolase [Nocardioides sp. S-1144]QCW49962.1 alpha/beta hydrolase [Nocardioides sp. S-1144]